MYLFSTPLLWGLHFLSADFADLGEVRPTAAADDCASLASAQDAHGGCARSHHYYGGTRGEPGGYLGLAVSGSESVLGETWWKMVSIPFKSYFESEHDDKIQWI